eukprot:scaffold56777_cov64-Phaeocystis_antarctica.AAC.10
MAVCGSRTARASQAREAVRAAAAKVAAVELRVGDGGRRWRRVSAGKANYTSQLHVFGREFETEKRKEKSTGTLSDLRTPTRPERLRVHCTQLSHVSTRAAVIGRPPLPGTSAPRHRRGRPAAPRHAPPPMLKLGWLRPRPAGSPEASFSARSCSRLPLASASLGQSASAALAALAGHIGRVFHIGHHGGEGPGDGANRVADARLSLQCDAQLGALRCVLDVHDAEGQAVHAARHLVRVNGSAIGDVKGAWLGGQWAGHSLGVSSERARWLW